MTYSVKWEETTVSFARRFDVYLDYPFFEHQVSIVVYYLLVTYMHKRKKIIVSICLRHIYVLDTRLLLTFVYQYSIALWII